MGEKMDLADQGGQRDVQTLIINLLVTSAGGRAETSVPWLVPVEGRSHSPDPPILECVQYISYIVCFPLPFLSSFIYTPSNHSPSPTHLFLATHALIFSLSPCSPLPPPPPSSPPSWTRPASCRFGLVICPTSLQSSLIRLQCSRTPHRPQEGSVRMPAQNTELLEAATLPAMTREVTCQSAVPI